MMIRLLICLCLCSVLAIDANAGSRGDRLGKLKCEPGQVSQFDGQSWRCADLPPVAPTVQLFDSSEPPKQVGYLLDYTDDTARVLLNVQGETVLLNVRVAEFFFVRQIFFFAEDCRGDAYSSLSRQTPDGPLRPTLYGDVRGILSTNDAGDVILYLTDGDVFSGVQDVMFRRYPNGDCVSIGVSSPESKFIPIVPTLNITKEYTPPFRLLIVGN